MNAADSPLHLPLPVLLAVLAVITGCSSEESSAEKAGSRAVDEAGSQRQEKARTEKREEGNGPDKAPARQEPGTTVVKKLGEEMQLTSSPVNDEDASIIRARDGYFYAAFWSARDRGFADIFMKRSIDGRKWSDAWLVVSSSLADLGPQLCQTSDGTFHLAWWRGEPKGWRIPQNIFYSHSPDSKTWSPPRKITDTNTNDWGCHTICDANDRMWIVWSSQRTGNKDIHLVYSDDKGKTWSDPLQVTDHPFDDDFPFLLQRRNGTYLLVWTRLDQEQGSFLSNKTSETFYATSRDGIRWDRPVAVTNDTDYPFLDILPTAYETKDDCYIVWVTWHRATPNDADAVEVPLSDPRPERAVPLVKGFSVRVVPADGEKFIVFYVHDEIEKETDKGDNNDVYYQFFERVPAE